MPRGQQAPLEERLKAAKTKVEKTEKAYKEAKAKLDKLELEENTNMLQEIAALAKEQKMSVNDYLKAHLQTKFAKEVTIEYKQQNAE